MSPKLRALLFVVPPVVILDRITKWMVVENVPLHGRIDVIDGFFRITHARNSGAALGLFQDFPIWVFIGLTLVALGFIASFYRQLAADDVFSATALALILGGALGNLVDRSLLGEVVDFLQFDLKLFIFPDFNVADSAIVIGVGLLLLDAVAADSAQGSDVPAKEPEPGAR
jgi:signal peptidase II